jgi:DNA-binding response OmpR family regulator
MTETILIVEDQALLADDLELYLRHEGYRTERAADGRRALELWRAARPSLILLDLMIPVIDGFEVARRVRAESETPIIMVTARDQEIDKLLGLGLGADDYVIKPYSPREVVARVRAVLRRTSAAIVRRPSLHTIESLEVETEALEARCAGERLDLTLSEFRLLSALVQAAGAVCARPALHEIIRTPDGLSDPRNVDTHIKNLRRKLGRCEALLETVRGVGYRIRVTR